MTRAGSLGLAPDEPPYPPEWREPSGVVWARQRRAKGEPADPLLAALYAAHPRMHDGAPPDEAARRRIAGVLLLPQRPAPAVAMREVSPDETGPGHRRGGRIAALVPAGTARSFVPQHRRIDDRDEVVIGRRPELFVAVVEVADRPSDRHTAALVAETEAGAPAVLPPSGGAPAERISAERLVASQLRQRQTIDPATLLSAPPADCALTARAAGADAARIPPNEPASALPHPVDLPLAAADPVAANPVPTAPVPAKRRRSPKPSVPRIAEAVAGHFAVPPAAIFAGTREHRAVRARQVAWWLARRLLKRSYPKLGQSFHRDPSSIVYGVQVVDALRATDGNFAAMLGRLERAIRTGEAVTGPAPSVRLRKIAP